MNLPTQEIFASRFPLLYDQIKDLEPLPLKPIFNDHSVKEESEVYLFAEINFAHFFDIIYEKAMKAKTLILLEKDLHKIKGVFALESFCKILSLPHIHIVHWDGIETIKGLAWKYLGLPYQIIANSEPDRHLLEKIFQGVVMVAIEFQDFGVSTFHNVFQNILQTEKIRMVSDLFGQFKKMPAIICGAGPSLSRDIDQLKKWNSHALVFAGGATLESLSKHGVDIHFAATIDPNSQRSRFLQFTDFTTPFFVQFRMSKSIYRDVHGEKIWAGSSPGFFLEEAIYQLLGLPKIHFDGGWVVSNFLAHMAYLLGCDPIIFVGMDHSWNHEELYEKGVSDQREMKGFKAKGLHGKEVWTKPDFFWAQDWFSQFAKNHPDINWINATSEGLPIDGILHQSLNQSFSDWKPPQMNMEDLVHHKIQDCPFHLLHHSKEIFQVLICSLQQCDEYAKKSLEVMERIYHQNPEELIEIEEMIPEIKGELFYQTVLIPMWEIWKSPHIRVGSFPQVKKVLLFLDVLDRYQKILIY